MDRDLIKAVVAMFFIVTVVILIGLAGASFITFVVGLFIVFPFTIANVFKVWLALVAFKIITAGIWGKE